MLRNIINRLELIYQLLHIIINKLDDKEPIIHVEDEMLTINETADFFKVTDRTVRRWQADRLINPTYIGGTVYFSKAELKQTLKMNRLNKK